MSEYDNMTVAELKVELKEAGLPVSGKKAELIARLEEFSGASEEIAEVETEEIEEEMLEEDDEDFDDMDEEWDDEEMIHVARQKPELDDATRDALSLRKSQSKKQPAFRRQEWYRYKRLSRTGWRKPKGMDSKQRKNKKWRTPMARVGFGKVSDVRGLHPSGFAEVMVHRPDDLDQIDPKTEAARIGRRVGNRKRAVIHERADELGIRVLNRRRGI
ncbi:MAG: 50S ribosomal protein L32e [Candidatus Thalassarchaeaceae archaeon]|jgi:large subunit ribosomal protein L32e|nr:50S ribosomal protein L32e [Candidatus Thalassarchaeaceae archaeon]MDP7043686.1 50S ribosomal protein L32e [Candidatus Thalassarchaeaceae archaeon]